MSEVDPRALVRRCQAGDEAAWAELYRGYAPLVARFVGRMVGPRGPVEDLVQSVFVQALRSIRDFRGDARVTTWLYGVAQRVTCKHLREDGRRRRRDGRWLEGQTSAGDSPEPAMLARESLATIEAAVLSLPDAQRVVWVMRELEGLSTEEVGDALGLPQGTVRSRLFAARRAVLEALERRPPAGGDAGAARARPRVSEEVS